MQQKPNQQWPPKGKAAVKAVANETGHPIKIKNMSRACRDMAIEERQVPFEEAHCNHKTVKLTPQALATLER